MTRSRLCSLLFPLAPFLALPCLLHAQDTKPWTTPHFSLPAKDIYQQASLPVPADGASASVLDDEESDIFDAEGKNIHTEYTVYKVLTQKGVDGWDNISIEWEPWRQTRPTIRARVITPDYAAHDLDIKTLTDAPVQDEDSNVYSDRRLVRAPLPAIAPGSVVEEETVVRDTAPLFIAGTVGRDFFGRVSIPVEHSMLTLQGPSSMTVHYVTNLLSDFQPTRTDSQGILKLVFERGRMEPLDEAEANLPSDVPSHPSVTFSTGESWQHVAEEYRKIVDAHIGTADLKPLVEKLVAGKTSRDDKLRALLKYLDEGIRYTGVEFGEAAIVPHSPTETIAHGYGDCKDKATLLVAMLRASGIPAYVALLNAGERFDIPSDLPGMGLFDHAIVYVPGTPEFWIDATDQYAKLGQLPANDQGRLALIVAPQTTSLIRTAESSSQDNVLFENREIYLAENGPARIVETSQPRGVFESEFRDYYTDMNTKTRESLTDYMKSQYLTEKLDHLDRSKPENLDQQFELILESQKARRGYTELDSAQAAIRLEGLFYRLPDELQKRADDDSKPVDSSKPKKNRTADYALPQAFTVEWKYKIVPPLGFQPKPLPHDTKLPVGPAVLSESFTAQKDGVVLADIRFDTVKRRFSVAEATEMRNRIAELKDGEPILINFEPTANALLAQGKLRESFQSYRSLIAQHPSEALHHLQIAKALLDVGMGEAARQEAYTSIKLEPKSALAQKTLAVILESDLVGRKFRPGSDLAGATVAFREATKLDPDDKNTAGDFAILLEYNDQGVRYAQGSHLKEAITLYRSLGAQKLSEIGLANNLAFALFYDGDFAEAKQNAETLNPQPTALLIACEAALKGFQSAFAEVTKRSDNDRDAKNRLKVAGEMLMKMRKYSIAADLFQAGASGENAAATEALANNLRKAHLHEQLEFENTPTDLVRKYFLLSMDPDLTVEKLSSVTSRNGLKEIKNSSPEEMKRDLGTGKRVRYQLARQGTSVDVTLDLMMQMISIKEDGDDTSGYRERVQLPGGKRTTLFVVREDGKYRLLDSADKPGAVGLEVLDCIAGNNLTGAAMLLNWLREEQHLAGGDDPLAGEAFPRLWTKSNNLDVRQMKIAAASLLSESKSTAKQGIPILEEALKTAIAESERTDIDLALLDAAINMQDNATELAIASDLAQKYPDSRRLFLARSSALRALGRTQEADELARNRLEGTADDIDALRALALNAMARSEFRAAYEQDQRIVAAGRAEATDFNEMAWSSLFFSRTGGPDLEAAVKAAQMNSNNPGILHTVGCIYAEIGKTKEARDVLLEAMDLLDLAEPDSNYWYAFGRIAEQYGESNIAASDYAKVTQPESPRIPYASYDLAQARLKILQTGLQQSKLAAPVRQ